MIDLDDALDALVEAAQLENPARRAFELEIARRNVDSAVDALCREACRRSLWEVAFDSSPEGSE